MSKPENTLESQLSAIDQSKTEILVLILATILSYYTVDIQRQQLVCTAAGQELCDCLPKTLPIRAVSSILVISALKFFTRLSSQTLEQPEQNPKQQCKNEWNHLSNLLVLFAAVIRFGLILLDDSD